MHVTSNFDTLEGNISFKCEVSNSMGLNGMDRETDERHSFIIRPCLEGRREANEMRAKTLLFIRSLCNRPTTTHSRNLSEV